MGIILFGIILLCIGLTIAIKCNQPFYKTAPFGLTGMISILFFGSFWIDLELLFWGITGLGLICMGYLLVQRTKALQLIDGSVLFFAFMVIYFSVVLSGRELHLTDEFSYWGTAAKNMFYTNHLPTNYDSIGNYREYIPGCALLQYYVLKLNVHYLESALFQTIAVFLITMLLPFYSIIANLKSKKRNILVGMLILCIPMIFNYAYTEITIDTSIGVLFGYIVVLFLLGRKNASGNFERISAVLGSVVLTTFKAPGIGFVLIIGLVLILLSLLNVRRKTIDNRLFIKEIVTIGVVFGISLLAKMLWKNYMVWNDIKVYTTGGLTGNQLIHLLKEGLNPEQMSKFKSIVKLFFYPQPSLNICSMSYIGWYLLFAGISCLTVKSLSKQRKQETIIIQIGFGIGALLYLLYLIGLYLFAWPWYPDDGGFYKYYNTYLLGYLIILIYLLLSSELMTKYKNKLLVCIIVSLILLGRIYETVQITIAAPVCNMISQKNREETRPPWMPELDDEDIMAVFDGAGDAKDAPLIFNYEFTPYRSVYYGTEELMDLGTTQLEEDIRFNNISYLYVNRLKKEEKLRYASLFGGEGNIFEKTYYKVTFENEQLRFEKYDTSV